MSKLPNFIKKIAQIYSKEVPIEAFSVYIDEDGLKKMYDENAPGKSEGIFLDHKDNENSTCILWEVEKAYTMGTHWHSFETPFHICYESIIPIKGRCYYEERNVEIIAGQCYTFLADEPHTFSFLDDTSFYILYHPKHPVKEPY